MFFGQEIRDFSENFGELAKKFQEFGRGGKTDFVPEEEKSQNPVRISEKGLVFFSKV